MALPVAPPPKSNDVVVIGWAALTVRITWTLLTRGVKVRPEVLRDVRTHVLYHLDANTPLPQAEDLATHLTEVFVARVKGRPSGDPEPSSDWNMSIHPRWRRTLERTLDELGQAVFVRHYGSNRSVAYLEEKLHADRSSIESVIDGLRAGVRDIGVRDGLPLDEWSPERIDRLLRRLAAWSPGPCPPPLDIAEGCHAEHRAHCPRCDRTFRLVQGALSVDELIAPSIGARPNQRTRALALQLRPDARHLRAQLLRELPVSAFPIDDDGILLDGHAIDRVGPFLRMAAEVGLPEKMALRGAMVEGPGQWTPRGLLGPLGERAAREARHRTWGQVDGVGELPGRLREPPSARGWWGAVGVTTVAAATLAAFALGLSPPRPTEGLEAEFTPGRGGIWAAFDVPDEDYVYVVSATDEGLTVVLDSDDAGDKIEWATGDGSYRLHAPGRGVLVAASATPLPDFALRVARTQGDRDGLASLARELGREASVSWAER
jgi:hypothetical protein